jgi:hypothetical protein
MIHKNLAIALIAGGGYIGGALALKAMERAGFFPHETTIRAFAVFSGLALAVYANFLPKKLGSFRNPAVAMCMESVLRVSGWAYMLGGLAYAVTSLLAVPDPIPATLLLTATAYVLGYSSWAFMESTRRKGGPA